MTEPLWCPHCHAGLTAQATLDRFTTECPCCHKAFTVQKDWGSGLYEPVREWHLPSALLALIP